MKRYPSLIAASLLLVALAPLQTRAADNTWNNASTDFLWNGTSLNWASPTAWVDGDSAIFGATGAGTVTLGSPITAQNLTFNAAGYTIAGVGNALTLAGTTSTIAANAGTSNVLAVSILGTNGVTFQGTGTTVLAGDDSVPDANHYTGASYFRSGTVILQAAGAGNGATAGDPHAVESIEALDTGATLKFGTTFEPANPIASQWVSAPGEQIGARIPGTKMTMTGGTLDLNNDPKNEVVRVPDGFGLIVNNGSSVQVGLNVIMDGLDHTFSGVIADGNNGVLTGDNFADGATPQGPGYQIGIVSIAGTAGSTWTLAGDNTYSGSTRIDGGTIVKLAGNHSLGIPTLTGSLTGPLRIQNGSALDLNGRNQTIALMTAGQSGGQIYNSAVGTVATLTVGYGNEQAGRNAPYQLMDNTGVGGVLALRKIITQPFALIQSNITTSVVTSNWVTTCVQGLRNDCVATYSGDTSIEGGTLDVQGTSAISPNSAYRITTTGAFGPGVLQLSYAGDAPCRQLWINGVQQPNGTYGAGTPGIDPTSTGTITVTGADFNTWKNGSLNFAWDLTSTNWTSPTIWSDGNDAIFGATGAGTVTLGTPITAKNLTFNAAGYTIAGGGNALTLAGTTSTITANAGTSNVLAVSILGTNAVTFQGTGTTVLAGDASVPDANHYTGASYFRSGTVILAAAGAANGSTAGDSHAVESIEALDTGATVKFGTTFEPANPIASQWVSAPGEQIGARIPGTKMTMTGGTLDLNNDPKNEVVRVPDGFGLIVNNGSSVQVGLNVIMDGLDHTFSGVIADGNNGVLTGDNFADGATPQGPGYQIGIVSIAGTAGSTWTLAGDNTYSGSTRIDGGTIVKLAGNHSLGIPTLTGSLTGPLRIQNGSALDLNGRNQTIALMTAGQSGGQIYNSAVGTVATLTVGYGNEQAGRNAPYQLMDNTGVGGVLALRKIITQPFALIQSNITTSVVTSNWVTTCVQGLRNDCVATYSGDTSIEGGTLDVQGTSAISPNSAYRITTTGAFGPGVLQLSYAGDAPCRQLWINGVQQPNGTYGAGTPGIDPTSTGTITVTGYAAPPTLGFSQSGSTLTFSWTGNAKLQSQTNSLTGTWFDYPSGGTSPVIVTVDNTKGSVFFRLSGN